MIKKLAIEDELKLLKMIETEELHAFIWLKVANTKFKRIVHKFNITGCARSRVTTQTTVTRTSLHNRQGVNLRLRLRNIKIRCLPKKKEKRRDSEQLFHKIHSKIYGGSIVLISFYNPTFFCFESKNFFSQLHRSTFFFQWIVTRPVCL